jgi:hypothetical protein
MSINKIRLNRFFYIHHLDGFSVRPSTKPASVKKDCGLPFLFCSAMHSLMHTPEHKRNKQFPFGLRIEGPRYTDKASMRAGIDFRFADFYAAYRWMALMKRLARVLKRRARCRRCLATCVVEKVTDMPDLTPIVISYL